MHKKCNRIYSKYNRICQKQDLLAPNEIWPKNAVFALNMTVSAPNITVFGQNMTLYYENNDVFTSNRTKFASNMYVFALNACVIDKKINLFVPNIFINTKNNAQNMTMLAQNKKQTRPRQSVPNSWS